MDLGDSLGKLSQQEEDDRRNSRIAGGISAGFGAIGALFSLGQPDVPAYDEETEEKQELALKSQLNQATQQAAQRRDVSTESGLANTGTVAQTYSQRVSDAQSQFNAQIAAVRGRLAAEKEQGRERKVSGVLSFLGDAVKFGMDFL